MNTLNPEFEPYVRQAMHLAGERNRPMSDVEADFERLIAAVYIDSREKLLAQIRSQTKQPLEPNIDSLPYF